MKNKLRFAPSPTGYLHIGNARTVILNYLFIKSINGEMLLRIDDTDIERSRKEFDDAIIEDLDWLGIKYNDLIRQSDRSDKYDEAANILKKIGLLYPCYETDEELQRKRKLNLSQGKPPVYDRSALSLTQKQHEDLLLNGKKPHWRFKLDRVIITWDDLMRGEQKIDCSSSSDPVLIREDGSYLYTLPSVVDDIDMSITHVIRGEDHVSNTASQIQLYKALKSEIPIFGHHSLMVAADGSRLSKRTGSKSIKDIREDKIESITVTNYCARIGTSKSVEAFHAIDGLIESFDINDISRSPARFNFNDLELINAKILQSSPYTTVKEQLENLNVGGEDLFWDVVKPNLTRISEAKNWWDIAINDEIFDNNNDVCKVALELLPVEPWDDKTWKVWTNSISERTGLRGKALFLPLRIALTGQDHGPNLSVFLPFIGPIRTANRLNSK
jgi:glutamyl-tRNA synthetase